MKRGRRRNAPAPGSKQEERGYRRGISRFGRRPISVQNLTTSGTASGQRSDRDVDVSTLVMPGRLFRIRNSLRKFTRSHPKEYLAGTKEGSPVRMDATCPALPSPSRPLKSAAAIAQHNRTEVRSVGYCASLERPLDKRRGERKRKKKERERSGGKLEGTRSSGGSRFISRTGKGTEIPEVNRLMDGGQAGSVGGGAVLL